MGKLRSSGLRQVPWQSWEHWNWVATELFAESPERISSALDRIAAWQSRGKVPIAVETSAAIVGIHQRDPQVNYGIREGSALPEEMLRMMYSMAIQRLVNGVVDQSQKRNTTSVAERAQFAGLPRLLVDVRHEAAHTELPGLTLLHVASKQALAWLKLHYWDQQKETLFNVRLELKSKLVEHCLLVADILNPSARAAADLQQSEDNEQESDSKSEKLLEVVSQGTLRVKKQQRKGLVNELLDLSLSSISNVISTLVDDGLLEQDTLVIQEDAHSKQPIHTGATNGADLTSATDSAWKFTLRELSSHMPRLPEMLLVAIIKHINKSYTRRCTLRRPEEAGPTMSKAPDFSTNELTDSGSRDSSKKNRLISWCAWLLGKSPSVQDTEDSSEKQPRKSKLLKISNSPFVRANLNKELLGDLLRLCLSTSNGKEPLVDLVSLISPQLGNERFQHRVAALAQLGARMQRLRQNVRATSENQEEANKSSVWQETLREGSFEKVTTSSPAVGLHQTVMDTSENQENAGASSVGQERPQEGSFEKVTSSSPAAGRDSSPGSESTMESALEVARRQQRALQARLSSRKKDAEYTSDSLSNEEQKADRSQVLPKGSPLSSFGLKNHNSSVRLRQEGSEIQNWTVVEKWRSCAIGMIPSPCHSVGILPSLDSHKHVHGADRVVRKIPGGVSNEETSAATPEDENNLTTAGRVELVVEKRTTDEQLDGSRESKLQKTGRHVHFGDECPMDVDEEGVGNASGESSRGPMTPDEAVGHKNERIRSGSLLQGCLLQQGMFMRVTPDQFESLKSAVHVL